MNETVLEFLLYGIMILAPVILLVRQHFINKAPTYIASATVLSKQVVPARVNGKYSSSWNHLVTFQLSDGDTIELYTGNEAYHILKEGIQGTLCWQNEDFLEFDSEEI